MKAACLVFFLLAGCSLFGPRDATAPSPSSFLRLDFSNYLDVLNALVDSVYGKPGKSGELGILLDDSLFMFEGDSLDATDLPAVPRQWNRSDEIRVTASILSDTGALISELGGFDPQPIYTSSDSAVVAWDYRFTRKDGVTLKGRSTFAFVRRQGRFYLREWKDLRDPGSGYKSWGRWKMERYY